MTYELIYWPHIQGRGEFVRLALEALDLEYVDVAREGPGGPARVVAFLREHPGVFASPVLRDGEIIVAQTANILAWLGSQYDAWPEEEQAQLEAMQRLMTVMDLVAEAHDTHHPLDLGAHYEEQKDAAKVRARAFRTNRLGRFLSHFERTLGRSYAVGDAFTVVDLALTQVLDGLEYAFPRAFARATRPTPGLLGLRDRVKSRPRVTEYLASPRRIPFNEKGIFRRYPELDDPLDPSEEGDV